MKTKKDKPKLEKLRELEQQAQQIRDELKISKKGEVIFQEAKSAWSDREIIVEADGFGGATLQVVEGEYPLDYFVHDEKAFSSEEDACQAAEEMVS